MTDFDPAKILDAQPLAEDEIALLRELSQSSAWGILTTKVWPRISAQLALRCCTQRTDHDYNQGYYEGFRVARASVERLINPPRSNDYGVVSDPEAVFHARFRR